MMTSSICETLKKNRTFTRWTILAAEIDNFFQFSNAGAKRKYFFTKKSIAPGSDLKPHKEAMIIIAV